MPNDTSSHNGETLSEPARSKVKFEIFGEEMLEKVVKSSGNSGRVYIARPTGSAIMLKSFELIDNSFLTGDISGKLYHQTIKAGRCR